MFASRDGVEISLLLSLVSSRENLYNTLSRFEDLGIDRIILTKMDECRRFGFSSTGGEGPETVFYVSTGQTCPMISRR